jgi:chloramphenicol 3-O phosphotransferase
MPQSHIIFLNGASSAGKTTLAKALQAVLDRPYFHLSSDQMVEAGALPGRREEGGEFSWASVRPRFFHGFHRSLAAYAGAGNCLVVDHVLEYAPWLTECAALLAPFPVFLVGVHCPLAELERRERARGDRRVGEAEEHLKVVHTFGPYDFEVDTSVRSPEENARLIQTALQDPPTPSAFRRIACAP